MTLSSRVAQSVPGDIAATVYPVLDMRRDSIMTLTGPRAGRNGPRMAQTFRRSAAARGAFMIVTVTPQLFPVNRSRS
jgi:hypothetical protein